MTCVLMGHVLRDMSTKHLYLQKKHVYGVGKDV